MTARVGYPYIKKYREERELSVIFLIDMSSSGFFGTKEHFKEETAAELCALLAFSAIKNNDKVGMIIFTDRIEKFIPPKKGKAHVLRLIREILCFKPEGTGTDIGFALEYFNRVIKKKSVVFLISDFLSSDYLKPLQIGNRKHDIIAVKISDPRELTFENVGLIELEDAETGEILVIDTGSSEFRLDFAQKAEADNFSLKRTLKLINMDFIQIITNQTYIVPLINFFKMREKRP
ncbi:MAG: VWA domain-containing protein [candidate division Zixibacteria bacterium]|nr:VWA domain-containing protein [candidate division Zixibacteria bacterium]